MSHRALYGIVIGIFVVLLIVMFATFDYDRSNAEAEAKADQLIAAFDQAGLTVPVDKDQITEVLGDDGGEVCEIAGSDQLQGFIKTRYGVGGEFFFRPTTIDRKTAEGLALVVATYCPDELPNLQEFVDDLDFDDVIRD